MEGSGRVPRGGDTPYRHCLADSYPDADSHVDTQQDPHTIVYLDTPSHRYSLAYRY